jgi:serine/threonine protein kinase
MSSNRPSITAPLGTAPALLSEPPGDFTEAQPVPEPVEIGQMVAGKYRIEKVLGSSGMGVVYLAEHTEIGQRVAIKFLLEGAKNPQALARFKREARVMAKVKNKHAVRIVDVGQLDAATPYIVMEYLEGQDLSSLTRSLGQLSIPFTCDVLMQVCEALASAHQAGVVHRDLKPSNIFLTAQSDGTQHVTVIDFGVAKLRDDREKSEEVTQTSTLVGSPRYMSPEQISGGRNIDHRVDVWALGVIMQEMLTNERVFKGDGVGMLLVAIATQAPAPVRQYLPTVPPELEQLLARTLDKDPASRTPNVAAFARVIAGFVPGSQARLGRILSTLGEPDAASASGARSAVTQVWGSPAADSQPSLPSISTASGISSASGTMAAGVVGPSSERNKRSSPLVPAIVGVVLVLLAVGGVAGWRAKAGATATTTTSRNDSAPTAGTVGATVATGPTAVPSAEPAPTQSIAASPSTSALPTVTTPKVGAVSLPVATTTSVVTPTAPRPAASASAKPPAVKKGPGGDLFDDPK